MSGHVKHMKRVKAHYRALVRALPDARTGARIRRPTEMQVQAALDVLARITVHDQLELYAEACVDEGDLGIPDTWTDIGAIDDVQQEDLEYDRRILERARGICYGDHHD